MAGKPNKLAFLSMPAPASYVAGLGRGASGFTTRSDIGPAREGPSAEVIAEAQARRGEEAEVDPDQFQDPDNEYGLFAGTTYEADDEEADRIYEKVDEAMDARRKARREAQEQLEMAKHRAERPKIQAQFADLKRGLTAVTDAEWEGIPEVGNLTRKKRKTEGRTYVVPDSILVGDRERGGIGNVVQDGQETPANTGTLTNFVEIGQARDKILSLKLDQISGTATSHGASGTSTSIDPKGYLTSLDSVQLKSSAEIGDIKRARMLFDSLVKSNPKHAPGWIAAACLEEHAGRMVAARKLIREGCERCPASEDVWLEAARLHSNDDAKVILANAVQHVGQSVKIWLAAADLEGDVKAKKRVLRKALEHIPNSVRLWKETVNLETSATDARTLLSRAVEVIPLSVELWLALARIETPDKAKAVLNKARKAVPTSHEIWIAAGRLLEQEAGKNEDSEKKKKEMDTVDKTIEGRQQWLKEAERCESEGSVRTCEAIVKATVGMELEDEDRLDTWIGDAESVEGRGMVYPDKRALWQRAADLEKTHGTREGLDELLGRAVECCPQAEVLWLMAAKEKWLAGDVPGARGVLERAGEQIWLAAVKLEAENGETGVARQLLVRARDQQQGQIDEALKTLSTALKKFSKFAKLYMVQGQIYEDRNDIPSARASYAAGIKSCPKEPTLWMLASRLEEKDGKSIKARALLEKARQVNPGNEWLWLESIGVEERSGGGASQVLSRALQDCPTSGVLWSKSIWSEPRPMRKARSADALKKTGGGEGGGSAVVICTVARLFWAERKVEKARQWFGRAVGMDGDLGDLWGWWLKFERQHGVEEQREEVRLRCVQAEPHHGIVWPSVAKDLKNVGKGTREILELVADKLEE
ncbi:PRP1 splicing factor, N-terminal-domain-containing protein [Armillaria novae-zelandiae]|uniref:PRP1 splicing factor, N-terminal-domain-containing protein n=1 Tax=Armillaria novae-zelandiae TaxID=153914 RepID=A0AA39NAU6_9AGAR|nr:PRP1 splicing factor, N-terminal-domain-containing protein [Armillaria novae-zelandiae]